MKQPEYSAGDVLVASDIPMELQNAVVVIEAIRTDADTDDRVWYIAENILDGTCRCVAEDCYTKLFSTGDLNADDDVRTRIDEAINMLNAE